MIINTFRIKKLKNTIQAKYDFTKNKTIVQGLYYKWGHDVKAYTELMEEGMNEAIKDLDAKLASINISELKNKGR